MNVWPVLLRLGLQTPVHGMDPQKWNCSQGYSEARPPRSGSGPLFSCQLRVCPGPPEVHIALFPSTPSAPGKLSFFSRVLPGQQHLLHCVLPAQILAPERLKTVLGLFRNFLDGWRGAEDEPRLPVFQRQGANTSGRRSPDLARPRLPGPGAVLLPRHLPPLGKRPLGGPAASLVRLGKKPSNSGRSALEAPPALAVPREMQTRFESSCRC